MVLQAEELEGSGVGSVLVEQKAEIQGLGFTSLKYLIYGGYVSMSTLNLKPSAILKRSDNRHRFYEQTARLQATCGVEVGYCLIQQQPIIGYIY